jgi:hypothetical protein
LIYKTIGHSVWQGLSANQVTDLFSAMLPGFLVSTYRKYKEDTSIFTKWLCDNGAKCGYHLTKSTQNETPTKTAPRLKGKARKQAKEAANNGTLSTMIS